MSEITPAASPAEIQRARAAYLREILHPWSIRKLATRTGLSKAIVESRLNGSQALTIDDLRVIAPVAHKSPEMLLSELLAVDPRQRDYRFGASRPVARLRARTKAPSKIVNPRPVRYLHPVSEAGAVRA